jgi:hypothetical protein
MLHWVVARLAWVRVRVRVRARVRGAALGCSSSYLGFKRAMMWVSWV